MPPGFVYILGSDSGTLYIGVTSHLDRRILQHKDGTGSKFAARYGCKRLLYYERFDDIRTAITRETSLKGITRAKKLALIRTMNPQFEDLAKTCGWLRIGPKQSISDTDAAYGKEWTAKLPDERK